MLHRMTVTLHVLHSKDIDADTIAAFETMAKTQGKTPEQLLAEVITERVQAAKAVQAHPYQNANA